jgi:hypothetical protein
MKLLRKFGEEIFPKPTANGLLSSTLLTMSGLSNFSLEYLSDAKQEHINQESMATFFGHFPSGTSFRSLDHYRQLVLAKRF